MDVTYKELINVGRYDWPIYKQICENISCIVRGLPYQGPRLSSSLYTVARSQSREISLYVREAKLFLDPAFQDADKHTTAILNEE